MKYRERRFGQRFSLDFIAAKTSPRKTSLRSSLLEEFEVKLTRQKWRTCLGIRKIYILKRRKKSRVIEGRAIVIKLWKGLYKGVELYMAVKQKLIYDSTNLLAINDPRRTWNSTVVALNTAVRIISF